MAGTGCVAVVETMRPPWFAILLLCAAVAQVIASSEAEARADLLAKLSSDVDEQRTQLRAQLVKLDAQQALLDRLKNGDGPESARPAEAAALTSPGRKLESASEPKKAALKIGSHIIRATKPTYADRATLPIRARAIRAATSSSPCCTPTDGEGVQAQTPRGLRGSERAVRAHVRARAGASDEGGACW